MMPTKYMLMPKYVECKEKKTLRGHLQAKQGRGEKRVTGENTELECVLSLRDL